jgi:hypothetical protein
MSEETASEPETEAGQTAVVPSSATDDVALAWSADHDVEDDSRDGGRWRDRLRWAAAVVLLCATAAASAWLAIALYRQEFDSHKATEPKAEPAVAPVAPLPKPLPAEPAPPSAEPSLPSPTPAEHETVPQLTPQPAAAAPTVAPPLPDPPANAYETYVQLMMRDGILVTDSPNVMHDEAYWVCRARGTGDTSATNALIEKSAQKSPLLSRVQIRAVFADVVQAYCPEYSSR